MDFKDINHMIIFIGAWLMTNISFILGITIMLLQIYILIEKIIKMRKEKKEKIYQHEKNKLKLAGK